MIKINLPWSKSITNRDFILSSLCDWKCRIVWHLKSDDTIYMIKALKDLWIDIVEIDNELIIDWWIEKINWWDKEIYVHQSGTCMRFLTWFAILNNKWFIKITWEHRLLERPMWDLIDGIKQMWVKVESDWDLPPVIIHSSSITENKISMSWESSSQFFTSLLQVWALIKWWLEIDVVWDMVSKPYIDLSIEELRKFWIEVVNDNYQIFIIKEQKIKNPWLLQIEWDASALSYIANFSVLEWKKIEISNIWKHTKQWDYKYLDILKKYFWLNYISWENNTILDWINSDISDWDDRVVDFEKMPDVSMCFMSLAPLLNWKTVITWLQTLNLKECKRIDAMWEELIKLWVKLDFDDKSMTIYNWFNPPRKVEIETYNDHRIAMVFGVLKVYIEKNFDTKIIIKNPNCVSKTYPNFWDQLKILNKFN